MEADRSGRRESKNNLTPGVSSARHDRIGRPLTFQSDISKSGVLSYKLLRDLRIISNARDVLYERAHEVSNLLRVVSLQTVNRLPNFSSLNKEISISRIK